MNKPKIEYRNIDKLIPYINNSRKHSDEQVAQIAASIKEFGWTNPILVDGDNGIIAGHGRMLAARKLGMDTIPVIELAHLTETQKKALIIADNKLALNASWDSQMLSLEIETLEQFNFDVNLLGFDVDELNQILNNEQIADLGLLPEEKLNNFLDGDTKILRLAYDEQEFNIITTNLLKLKENMQIDDFSTIIMAVVNEKCEKL